MHEHCFSLDVTMAAEQLDKYDVASSPLSQDASGELRGMVDRLLEHWRLTPAQQSVLLGFSPGNERLMHLLSIHQSLRTLFPQNQDLAYSWMTASNRAFNDQTPIEVVAERGAEGVAAVKAYLESAIHR